MLSKFIVPAFMAAGVLAAPLDNRAVQVVDVINTVTMTVTAGDIPTPAPSAAPKGAGFLEPGQVSSQSTTSSSQPATTSSVYTPPPAPTTSAVVIPVAPPSSAPAPAPSSSSSSSSSGNGGGSPTSGGVPILDTVNQWRSAYSLSQLVWDDGLASQALQVGQAGGGQNEVHQLIPNVDMGQVISPGQSVSVPSNQPFSPFEMAYLAWLCEIPTDSQLQPSANNGINTCSVMQDVLHMIYTETGHHQILVSPQWNKVGCAFANNPSANSQSTYQGLWTCNYST